MTRYEAIDLLERAHARLMDRLNEHSDIEFENMRVKDWTLKDLLAHISTWENVCAWYLGELTTGRAISLLDLPTDAFNARALAQDHELSLARVREEAEASFAGVRYMLEQLDDSLLDKEMRGPWHESQDLFPLHKIIAIDTWEHYQVHLADLDKLESEI